jgi:stress response protein YsnF
MEKIGPHQPSNNLESPRKREEEIISVVEEHAVIQREVIETGKVHIHKRVTEDTTRINLPIINEAYHIEHVPVAPKTLDIAPPAVRYEGDKMIISVLKEITVVQKKYEVIEEIHLTRKLTETPLVQEITLLKEHVTIERSGNNKT